MVINDSYKNKKLYTLCKVKKNMECQNFTIQISMALIQD